MGNVLKRYNGVDWEDVGGTVTGDTLPIGSVVEYDGATIPNGWEEIQDYSTNEIDTGKKWIDGKTIYKKVILEELTKTENSSFSKDYDVKELNIDTMLPIKYLFGHGNPSYSRNWEAGNYYNNSTDYCRLRYNPNINSDTNTIKFNCYVGEVNIGLVIILEYTKNN